MKKLLQKVFTDKFYTSIFMSSISFIVAVLLGSYFLIELGLTLLTFVVLCFMNIGVHSSFQELGKYINRKYLEKQEK